MKFILVFILAACYNYGFAQSLILEDVLEGSVRNSVPISNNGEVVGHAILYRLDKAKNGTPYQLKLLDENLKAIGSYEFEGTNLLQINAALLESGSIMLCMTDMGKGAEYERFVMTFDLEGKQTGVVGYVPTDGKKGLFGGYMAEMLDAQHPSYSGLEGRGFVAIYQNALKTGGLEVHALGLDGKLVWNRNLTAATGSYQRMYLLHTNASSIMLYSAESKSMTSKTPNEFIIGLDAASGKQVYKTPLLRDSGSLIPIGFKNDASGRTKMISKILTGKSVWYSRCLGINISTFNEKTGELTESKDYYYESDFSSVLEIRNGKKSDKKLLNIMDVYPMQDGSTVMIGTYKTGASADELRMWGDDNLVLIRTDILGSIKTVEHVAPGTGSVPNDVPWSYSTSEKKTVPFQYFSYSHSDELSTDGKITANFTEGIPGGVYALGAVTFDEKPGHTVKNFLTELSRQEKTFLERGKPGHILIFKVKTKTKTVEINQERTQ